MNESILTVDAVENLFKDCLAKDEKADNSTEIQGIVHTFLFDNNKIQQNKDAIDKLLLELPIKFRESSGGGYSFLMACNDKNGNQWTGLHLNMEKLFALGLASGRVHALLPREMWDAFPGGMPYYVITGV